MWTWRGGSLSLCVAGRYMRNTLSTIQQIAKLGFVSPSSSVAWTILIVPELSSSWPSHSLSSTCQSCYGRRTSTSRKKRASMSGPETCTSACWRRQITSRCGSATRTLRSTSPKRARMKRRRMYQSVTRRKHVHARSSVVPMPGSEVVMSATTKTAARRRIVWRFSTRGYRLSGHTVGKRKSRRYGNRCQGGRRGGDRWRMGASRSMSTTYSRPERGQWEQEEPKGWLGCSLWQNSSRRSLGEGNGALLARQRGRCALRDETEHGHHARREVRCVKVAQVRREQKLVLINNQK